VLAGSQRGTHAMQQQPRKAAAAAVVLAGSPQGQACTADAASRSALDAWPSADARSASMQASAARTCQTIGGGSRCGGGWALGAGAGVCNAWPTADARSASTQASTARACWVRVRVEGLGFRVRVEA